MVADRNAQATEVKRFITLHRIGVLSTLSQNHAGYPFGSIVPYDIDNAGRPVILISTLSEHYRNINHDPRTSLFVADSAAKEDPQPYARATLLGKFQKVPEAEEQLARKSFDARFPEAVPRSISHDFFLFRMSVERVRWIGGFGDIFWVEQAAYEGAPHDPVSYHGIGILKHMNDDHRDALNHYAEHYGKLAGPFECVQMTDVGTTGFTLKVQTRGKEQRINLSFPREVQTREEVRQVLIEMLRS